MKGATPGSYVFVLSAAVIITALAISGVDAVAIGGLELFAGFTALFSGMTGGPHRSNPVSLRRHEGGQRWRGDPSLRAVALVGTALIGMVIAIGFGAGSPALLVAAQFPMGVWLVTIRRPGLVGLRGRRTTVVCATCFVVAVGAQLLAGPFVVLWIIIGLAAAIPLAAYATQTSSRLSGDPVAPI